MQIECLTTFLDGRERFEKGDVRTVDDERGAYFIEQGWAVEPGGASSKKPGIVSKTLDIMSTVLGLGVKNG